MTLVLTAVVFFDPTPSGLTMAEIVSALAALPDPIVLNANRCVIDYQTSPQAVEDFVATVKQLAEAVPVEKRPERRTEKLGQKDGKFRINVLKPPSDPPAAKRVKLGY